MLNYHQEKETRLLFTCSSRCPSFTDLTGGEGPARCLETVVSKCCCEEAAEKNPVLCDGCREAQTGPAGLLDHMTTAVTSYLQMPLLLPVSSASSLAWRLLQWIPEIQWDMSWLSGTVDVPGRADIPRTAWVARLNDSNREGAPRHWKRLPSDQNLWDPPLLPPTPADMPASTPYFPWSSSQEAEPQTQTPPPPPVEGGVWLKLDQESGV